MPKSGLSNNNNLFRFLLCALLLLGLSTNTIISTASASDLPTTNARAAARVPFLSGEANSKIATQPTHNADLSPAGSQEDQKELYVCNYTVCMNQCMLERFLHVPV